MKKSAQDVFHFQGFRSPRYTQVPDEVFDELMPRLSGAELKVLLYIIRRTFGFKKERDNISLTFPLCCFDHISCWLPKDTP